jgi:phosphoglycerate dehydrogenase-like enzyme
MITAVLPQTFRPMVEGRLPQGIAPLWWATGEELVELAPQAQIGWFDMFDKTAPLEALRRSDKLEWLNSFFAGVDWIPLADLAARGVRLTNGSGLNANTVAEFAVMAMLAFARGHAEIVRAADRQEWIDPRASDRRRRELAGSKVLLMGYGEIGQAVGRMLEGFRAHVTPMRRSGGEGALGPDEWRARLGEFDWVVLAMPGTPKTRGMFDAATIAAMKEDGVLVNVARADIIDQNALMAALHAGRLGGAILDLTDPEPLPPGHPLWTTPNCDVTMHLAGLPTDTTRQACADRFIGNCGNFLRGEPLVSQVDLTLGY